MPLDRTPLTSTSAGSAQSWWEQRSHRDRPRNWVQNGREVKAQRKHRQHALRVAAGPPSSSWPSTSWPLSCSTRSSPSLDRTTDSRLVDRLNDARQQMSTGTGSKRSRRHGCRRRSAVPVVDRICRNGDRSDRDGAAPAAASLGWEPFTLAVGTSHVRFDTLRVRGSLLVAGQSAASISSVQSALLVAELVFGGILAVVVFGGATVVGLRASAPSELVRRRQAEFTADASHELRTPISVIEAEVGLALDRPRQPAEYREVLQRVGRESNRLRRIVEDLLWLARAD